MVGRGGRYAVAALAMLFAGPAAALSSPSSFCVGDPCVISADKDADPNVVLDFGTRTVVLQKQLNMLPLPTGALGTLTIRCGTFRITGDRTRLVVRNDLRPRGDGSRGTGTGLDNIRRRYAMLGAEEPEFRMTERSYLATVPILNEQP